jgi:nucleoporin NUP82
MYASRFNRSRQDGRLRSGFRHCLEHHSSLQNEMDLPVLLVHETLDLGLAAPFVEGKSCSSLANNALKFVADPIYPDLVYVYHAFGAHSISCHALLDALASSSDASACSAVQQELSTSSLSTPDDTLPVAGCVVIRDVYLGYSLLMMTNTFQVVARERSLAGEENKPLADSAAMDVDGGPAYLSLLSRPVFELAPPFNKPLHTLSHPRFALPPGETSSQVTAGKLRFVGQTVERLRNSIKDLKQADSAVQSRFDTQCKELGRQLGKIAEATQLIGASEKELASLDSRLGEAIAAQSQLVKRLDMTLHRLRLSHEPELSAKEQEWFEELAHVRKEVDPDTHGKTLRARLQQVHAQHDLLKEQLASSADSGRWSAANDMREMGKSQIQRIEAMLAIECVSRTAVLQLY